MCDCADPSKICSMVSFLVQKEWQSLQPSIRWRVRGSSGAEVVIAWTFKRLATWTASLPYTACSERPCLLFFRNPFFFLLPSCESATSNIEDGTTGRWLGLVNIRSVIFQLWAIVDERRWLCEWRRQRGTAGELSRIKKRQSVVTTSNTTTICNATFVLSKAQVFYWLTILFLLK